MNIQRGAVWSFVVHTWASPFPNDGTALQDCLRSGEGKGFLRHASQWRIANSDGRSPFSHRYPHPLTLRQRHAGGSDLRGGKKAWLANVVTTKLPNTVLPLVHTPYTRSQSLAPGSMKQVVSDGSGQLVRLRIKRRHGQLDDTIFN